MLTTELLYIFLKKGSLAVHFAGKYTFSETEKNWQKPISLEDSPSAPLWVVVLYRNRKLFCYVELLKKYGAKDILWQLRLWLFYSKSSKDKTMRVSHYHKALSQPLAELPGEQWILQTLLKKRKCFINITKISPKIQQKTDFCCSVEFKDLYYYCK